MNPTFAALTEHLYAAIYSDQILTIEVEDETAAKRLHWRFSQNKSRIIAAETDPFVNAALESLRIMRRGKVVLVGTANLFPDQPETDVKWLSPEDAIELIENG